ncbi:TetR/AcrR family transcriptional regulator [Lacticaseibacillus saniviri]|uniref:Transcription regulator n=1 Tax=Lacticaseibacillus saniviri JCM 17471 = DSM 24301 TaxID=1293598 RepID=A0A0R2MRV1_9LACO|nr:TetR/AcrR family transcriptional regulator [Lacticaseibacillus saniviri]KRO16318.1 transcription regulator [Lacticaseibacillus saniviri JCM 17471 = DSM 24301]MCG4281887.1 TetR/AcrR family transcriptional regulator [Lacticaseibacillus saniviri]
MAATKHAQSIKNDSKNYLATALLEQLQTTNLEDIKISKLVTRAGVSRMAFYRNFETVGDVLHDYFEPKIRQLFDDVIQQTPTDDKMVAVDRFFAEFEGTMILSIERHFEFVIRQIFFDNMQRLYRQLPTIEAIPEIERRYWVGFMSAGVYNIWREWLLHDKQDSLDEIHTLLATLQTTTFNALKQ